MLDIKKTCSFKASKRNNKPVTYLNHSKTHMNQSGCLQWSDNDFMPQVGKHQTLKSDTMAIPMLNYASIKASDNVQKREVQNYS